MVCTDIVHKLGLHLLKNCTQEGGVVAALKEEDHSTTPNPGDPTSPPDEEIPGECDDDDVDPVDEEALINSKT